ncbi:2-ketogluconate reductase [bioreactor metagenome]|uniref:2-ketogluconate reductase n=1 Tax=bioreactor metagenome TaxID=1076179 RepID=A0A644XTF1_9ZZZZ
MNTSNSPVQRVVQIAPVGALADALLASQFDAVRLWQIDDRDAWLREHAHEVDVLVTSVRAGCDASTMAQFANLRAVCSWGIGFDTIDVAAAHARGIEVSVTPDVLDDCVADMAWALMLAVARQIPAADRYVQTGQWRKLGEFPLATRVSGKRMGILGLGRIGRAIARRGEGFSMSVAYHGRKPQADAPYRFMDNLIEMAEWADFLVVACPGGPQTHHLINSEVLAALGTKGILINIARGSVVDTSALISALDQHQLRGAGLDVIEGEPGAPDALRNRNDVVFTPHIGSATTETREAMEQLVVDNVRAFREHGKLLTPITSLR